MKYVIPTQFALHIAPNLEKRGAKLIYPLKNRDNSFYHPDGTFYTRIPEAEGLDGDVLVLHSGAPNPNRGNVELDFILSILEWYAVDFDVFMLYYPYCRQDHICEPGETVYAKELARAIFWRGARKIYAVDAHFAKQDWVKDYPIENISTEGLFKEAVKCPDAVYMAPDIGAGKRFGAAHMDKKRYDSFSVGIGSPDELAEVVRRRTVVVRDDIISTGNTMVQARKNLLQLGANKVIAAATHGVGWYGLESVYMEYDGKLFVTNTIKNDRANIDVTSLVERALA
jgi:ribose-phosphate pyrophosphokinase